MTNHISRELLSLYHKRFYQYFEDLAERNRCILTNRSALRAEEQTTVLTRLTKSNRTAAETRCLLTHNIPCVSDVATAGHTNIYSDITQD